jgi:hypothetical protein
MKFTNTSLSLIAFLFLSLLSKGQMTNLVFFTEQGERFSVVLNGILQNDSPQTNIKITGLPAPTYKLKVIFEDPKIPELDKSLMYQQGTETTFNIRKNNKGEYVVRFLNQVPIEEVLPPPPAQKIYVYTTVPATTIINQTTVNSTTVNSTTVNNTNVAAGGNVSMNVSSGGVSTNINTSSTSMTTSSTTQGGTVNYQAGNPPPPPPKDYYIMPGYNGPIGCPYPISDLDFADVKRSISSKSFEDSKLTIAKEVTSSNCLFASEVKEVMMLFSFESTRLEFAKYAYDFTYDRGNYYKVNDAFQFESSIDELKDYIRHNHD